MNPNEEGVLLHPRENPDQWKCRRELHEFWDSGKEQIEITVFNKKTTLEAEKMKYYRASRQLGLGISNISLHTKKGKLYAKRVSIEINVAVHELTVTDKEFSDILHEEKRFILCKDEGYKLGDSLVIRPEDGKKRWDAKIIYVQQKGTSSGLMKGYCILGI